MDPAVFNFWRFKCADCKYYKEVAYKWGECLHYPCMAEPSDPACNEFEAK